MMMIDILVGWPGSGKSTIAGEIMTHTKRDKKTHYFHEQYGDWQSDFILALKMSDNIIIDRQNITVKSRKKLFKKIHKYVKGPYIIRGLVMMVHPNTALKRLVDRNDHPSIIDETTARKALSWARSKGELPTIEEGFHLIVQINTENVGYHLYSQILK